MIFDSSPTSWQTNEQLSPEKLNRQLLAAKSQLDELGRQKWRHFDIVFPAPTSTTVCKLPLIADLQYTVDRITIEGTYTGTPSITYKKAGDATGITWDFSNGLVDGYVNKVFFPGAVLDGYGLYTFDDAFVITSTDILTDIKITASCSCSKFLSSESDTLAFPTLYKDGDTLTNDRFDSDAQAVEDFVNALNLNAKPSAIFLSTFRNITNTTAQYLRYDTFPGSTDASADETVYKWVGYYEMNGTATAGQTITVYGSFNGVGLGETFSVAGTSVGQFELTSLGGTKFDRDINDATDDYSVQVDNSASTAIKKIDIFFVIQKV